MPVGEPDASPREPTEEPVLTRALRHGAWLELAVAGLALADLAINRLALRLVAPNARALWLPLGEAGALLRNLAALLGLTLLVAELFASWRVAWPERPLATLAARTAVAATSGLYVPSVVLALVTDRARVPSALLGVGFLGAGALVVVVGLTSIPARRSASARVSMVAGLTACLALAGMTITLLRSLSGVALPALGLVGLASRHGSELGWLLAPLTLFADRALRRRFRGGRRQAALALAAAVAVILLGLALQAALHADAARIAYAGFRLSSLQAAQTWLYAIPIGASVGLGLALTLLPEQRALGAAVLLWIAAGLAPRAPAPLLYEVLAALLFARVGRDEENRIDGDMDLQGVGAPAASTRLASS